ncbi:hypothetical protein TPDSL_40720 (plasmid) [Terrisporobacter petrolearius]|uniref:hypothetical protein n=1 Tax=Terrisporobacter petrolearius TaxID=1460447 RepID=UPI0032421406
MKIKTFVTRFNSEDTDSIGIIMSNHDDIVNKFTIEKEIISIDTKTEKCTTSNIDFIVILTTVIYK